MMAANSGTTAIRMPAVELVSRVSAWPSNTQGTLISMSVKASNHFQLRNAAARALRCRATGNNNSAPISVRDPATTSGSMVSTAMRMSR